jgi:hypothetical protein
MWALKQIEWKEDASDLMDKAESFYLNLREGRSWKKPHDDRARAYALKASDASVSSDSTQEIMESSISKKQSSTLKKYIKAFAANEKQLREQKYKWKQVPPKEGESTTKKVLVDGARNPYTLRKNTTNTDIKQNPPSTIAPDLPAAKRSDKDDEESNRDPKTPSSPPGLQPILSYIK